MSLPVFEVPKFKTTLPSNGKTVEFRPFLVKEQKQLLMVTAASAAEQTSAIESVIAACTNNAVDASRLPAFDAEHLFLQIRARSVGENVDIALTCGCGEKQNATLDLTSVRVHTSPEHTNKIDLGSNIMVILKYPDLQEISSRPEINTADDVTNMIVNSIDGVWSNDELFASSNYSREELVTWVDALSPAALDKIETFFATMPVLKHTLDWKCKACGADNSVTMEGMQSFFA